MSDFLGELAEMFPSWDAEALRAVHEANNGDQEKTLTQLLAWTAEDTPSAPSVYTVRRAARPRKGTRASGEPSTYPRASGAEIGSGFCAGLPL